MASQWQRWGREGNIYYVGKKALDDVQEMLKKGEEISEAVVTELADSKNFADNDIMVPVDLRGTGYDSDIFYDRDCFYEVLNPIAAAEAFVVAAVEFQLNKNGDPEDERPPPITAAE